MTLRSLGFGVIALAALAALGQTGNKDEPDAGPIPLELQLEYFRTDAVLAHLQADLGRAQAEYEAAVAAVVKACGAGAAPVLTQDKKHLFCVAQPTPPKN